MTLGILIRFSHKLILNPREVGFPFIWSVYSVDYHKMAMVFQKIFINNGRKIAPEPSLSIRFHSTNISAP